MFKFLFTFLLLLSSICSYSQINITATSEVSIEKIKNIKGNYISLLCKTDGIDNLYYLRFKTDDKTDETIWLSLGNSIEESKESVSKIKSIFKNDIGLSIAIKNNGEELVFRNSKIFSNRLLICRSNNKAGLFFIKKSHLNKTIRNLNKQK